MNERIARVSAPLSGTFTFFSRPFSVENVTGNIKNRIIVFITRDGQDAPDMRKVLPETLTAQEREILALICAGRSNREMTGLMNISMHTLRTHISNIYKKLGGNQQGRPADSDE